ncbi:hypothetical protein BDV18DRAFT_141388 [Aspergillus unguis]
MSLLSLPLEIRYEIYKLVFGNKTIGLVGHTDPRLCHGVCRIKGQKFHWFTCGPEDEPGWFKCVVHKNTQSQPRLPLLLTCRQIYSEAVYILWSDSPVYIPLIDSLLDFGTFSKIEAAVPQKNLQSIRSLEISFLHPAMDRFPQVLDEKWFEGWASVWSSVKKLKGLGRIQAWIAMDQEGEQEGNVMTAEQEERLFRPLMDLDWIGDFKVEVTWPANEQSESLLLDAPFHLTRDDEEPPDKPHVMDEENRKIRVTRAPRWNPLYIDDEETLSDTLG